VTSERQKAANRANARRSTGPKTPEGKAAVRLNAFRHGLLARDVVLPEEDLDAFEDLRNRVRADLSPVGRSRSISRIAWSILCGDSGAERGWRPRSLTGGSRNSR
jgi:hypothetical protein